MFNFAPGNGVEPYFRRRIGLIGGEPAPIRYGARLTGQAGANDLGFLQVRTGGAGAQPGESFTVARVNRNIFRQSTIGVIATRRSATLGDPGPELGHTSVGTDLNLTTSRFLGDRNLQLQAFYAWHNDPAEDAVSSWLDRSALGVRLSYPNDLWSGHISYRELGTHFNPAVGFTPRRGFRRVQPSIQYAPRPAWPHVRQLEFGVRGEYLTDMEGRLQTGNIGLDLLGVRFESGDRISIEHDTSREHLGRSFRIHPDTMVRSLIPEGEYTFGGLGVSGSTAGHRPVSASLSASRGGFWSGDRAQYGASVVLRPRPGFNFSAGADLNVIELPEADFTTDLLRLGGGWHINPWISLTGNVQYDNLSELVGLYTRFRWIVQPGSDLHVVYSHNWLNAIGGFETLQRSAASKLTYTHRF
ncbi:hypothetical protein BH23GEM3_BH23GEM3_03650 [soil metagenome]